MKIAFFSSIRHNLKMYQDGANARGTEVEFVDFPFPSTEENAHKIVGCDAILFPPNNNMTRKFLETIKANGIKYILTSSVGYDQFDLELMKEYGFKGCNVPSYSPNAIAEHTVLMLLSLLRDYKSQLKRADSNVFDVMTTWGKEIRSLNVGIIGAGRIGYTSLKCLSGFGPKAMYAYDLYENDAVKEYAQYVSLDEIYARCDAVLIHCNSNEDNYHMINDESIAKMKDGVFIVNVARGPLADTNALLKGIESGKIGGLGLDVLEEEARLFAWDGAGDFPVPAFEKLLSYSNVIFTPHSAFRTETAASNIISITIDNAYEYALTGNCSNELVK